jgi:hypothetical protein
MEISPPPANNFTAVTFLTSSHPTTLDATPTILHTTPYPTIPQFTTNTTFSATVLPSCTISPQYPVSHYQPPTTTPIGLLPRQQDSTYSSPRSIPVTLDNAISQQTIPSVGVQHPVLRHLALLPQPLRPLGYMMLRRRDN